MNEKRVHKIKNMFYSQHALHLIWLLSFKCKTYTAVFSKEKSSDRRHLTAHSPPQEETASGDAPSADMFASLPQPCVSRCKY